MTFDPRHNFLSAFCATETGMPLTSHKRSTTRESPSGSAHSSPARSSDQHVHHHPHPQQQATVSHTGASTTGDHSPPLTLPPAGAEHSSTITSVTHRHAHTQTQERGERHTIQERPGSGLGSASSSGASVKLSLAGSSHQNHRGPPVWGDKVTLLVDGKRFVVNPALFISHPNTMLGRWVESILIVV